MATSTIPERTAPQGARGFSLWHRQLDQYPAPARRYTYLAVTVLATVVLYYELYVQGAVATQIIHDYGFSFSGFVFISVVGNLVGSFGSLAAGLADRWGRANLVVIGLFITGLIILFVLPNAGSETSYLIFFAILSAVEGVMLVATPALIRDFSPQLGRASAMAFWTLGPVLGSLAVTEVSTHTLESHPDWRFQFYVCGVAGLVVAVLALLLLRELSPRLRDQLMVSLQDAEVLEARAKAADAEVGGRSWRTMLTPSVVGPAVGISLFLVFYYIAVGFFVVYFATIFHYSEARANAVSNWYWIFNVLGLLVCGYLSDKLLVRKPFMIVGAVGNIVATSMFAMKATQADTSYGTFRLLMMAMSFFAGLAYCAWMASFTETVEKRNPAATATGLAVYGGIVRGTVVVTLLVFGVMLPATSTLVDSGGRVAEVAGAIKPQHLAALTANPTSKEAGAAAVGDLMTTRGADGKPVAATQQEAVDDLKFLGAHAKEVTQAAKDSPGQWQRFWWLAVIAQVLFIPCVFLLSGRWRTADAKRDVEEYEAMMAEERSRLAGSRR